MSFRLRLIITISLLIAVTFGIGGTLLITTSFEDSLAKETDAALESYKTVRSTLYLLSSLSQPTDHSQLSAAISQIEEQDIARWQALTLRISDRTIYQSGTGHVNTDDRISTASNICTYFHVTDAHGHGLITAGTIPFGKDTVVLEVRFDLSAVYAARDTQLQLYLTIYSIVVLIGIGVATTLAFMLTHRLHKLTGAVRRIAQGDLNTRSQLSSHDEFGQLSRDFDSMADKLQEHIDRLEDDMRRQDAFMGAFAHELKTPMTSIIGYADLLRQGDLSEDSGMLAADYIFSEGKRLERLSFKLQDLLLLKNDTLPMRRIPLKPYLDSIEKTLAPALQQRGIRLRCQAEQAYATFEPDLVLSLLYNLIDNAAKAIDSDGVIDVEAVTASSGCRITVTDNGRGMAQGELNKITDAFYRVDKSRSRKQGGAGLGLALCKEIVALHRGEMRFTSKLGSGTTVTVTLYGSEENA